VGGARVDAEGMDEPGVKRPRDGVAIVEVDDQPMLRQQRDDVVVPDEGVDGSGALAPGGHGAFVVKDEHRGTRPRERVAGHEVPDVFFAEKGLVPLLGTPRVVERRVRSG